MSESPRRFPPPWSIDEQTESFIVRDAKGHALAYIYFEDEPQRRGIPCCSEHRQAAKRAAGYIEGHSETAALG
jgi:hypothetical protein